MIKHIAEKWRRGHRTWVKIEDGIESETDLSDIAKQFTHLRFCFR